jgi:hypothetical protein
MYFSANTLVAAFALMKALRLHHEAPDGAALSERLFSNTPPVKTIYGGRMVGETDTAKQKDDVFGFVANGRDNRSISADSVNVWPVGAFVFQGTIPHLAPDWRAFAKTAGAMMLVAREEGRGFVKIFSLFTEQLGSVVGLGKGIDFSR